MSPDPIGVASARERNATRADVIGAVYLRDYGEISRLHEQAVIRLTPADLDRLVDALTLARTAL